MKIQSFILYHLYFISFRKQLWIFQFIGELCTFMIYFIFPLCDHSQSPARYCWMLGAIVTISGRSGEEKQYQPQMEWDRGVNAPPRGSPIAMSTSALVSQKCTVSWKRIALKLSGKIYWPKGLPKTFLSPNVLFFHRISYCVADPYFSKVFAFISRAQGRQDLTCYAFLCSKESMVMYCFICFCLMIVIKRSHIVKFRAKNNPRFFRSWQPFLSLLRRKLNGVPYTDVCGPIYHNNKTSRKPSAVLYIAVRKG